MAGKKNSKPFAHPLEAALALDATLPPPAMPKPQPANAILEQWIDQGVPCNYVRFDHEAVQPAPKKEPMWELRTESTNPRYQVNAIFWTPHGVIFSAHGEMTLVGLGNVAYAKPI